jgi:nicotinate phosphoribosyltransferase
MSSALFTDHYELTMLQAARRSGAASRPAVFEVFTRSLPAGRRYGVVAGTGRLLDALAEFRFTPADIATLRDATVVDDETLDWLAGYRFTGDVDGYAEGEPYFGGTPVLTVTGTFGECVLLETLILSILNHDCAVAAAGARMISAAGARPCIEMGSRRTHERAAVAAARAARLVGFTTTSNLAALRLGVPTAGTSAHAFVLAHASERAAFEAQVAALGPGTTLLIDTYDTMTGLERAVEAAGTGLGAVRIDSGDLAAVTRAVRARLDELGATGTRIVATGDLDEYSVAALADAPVDVYGIGTALVTGSGAPTAGFVYKLVELAGRPVAKTSVGKHSHGGRKIVIRCHDTHGRAVADLVAPAAGGADRRDGIPGGVDRGGADPGGAAADRPLLVPLVRGGRTVEGAWTGSAGLEAARAHHIRAMGALPPSAFDLRPGNPCLPVISRLPR